MQYRRHYQKGATYFFTINLADRSSDLLVKEIATLRQSFKLVKQKHPFYIDAIVILPDHLHMLCTMPNNDADFSKRIKLIKYYFSYNIAKTESISSSRLKKASVVFGNVDFGSIAFAVNQTIEHILIIFI